jgi:hypothetical protein
MPAMMLIVICSLPIPDSSDQRAVRASLSSSAGSSSCTKQLAIGTAVESQIADRFRAAALKLPTPFEKMPSRSRGVGSYLQRHVCWLPRRRADQDLEQLADLALLDEGMTHGKPRHHLVAVSSTSTLAQHVALLDQLGHDPVRGTLRYPYRCGDIAQADARVMSHAGEDVGMVCQKIPANGCRGLLLLISGN